MVSRGPHNSAITWTPYMRVAWGGTLGTQGEIWTNSLKYVPMDNSVLTANMAEAAAPPVWAALNTWITTNTAQITTQATLVWLKINQVEGSGLQGAGATNYYAGAPVAGIVPTPVPLFQTYALSLRSGLSRGRGHIGRIFPPTVNATLNAEGRCDVATAGTMAGTFETCMAAMQLAMRTATSTVGGFSICSPGNTAKGTVPVHQLIIQVECDTVPDVQHRRTNKLKRVIGAVHPIPG